jgi:sec-independent protein translocase protein TatC
MSFGDHLDELRRRLIYALVTIVPIFLIAMIFGEQLLEIILEPAKAKLEASRLPGTFIATSPLEPMGAWIRVALVVTVVIGVPAILLQLWMFVAPGLYPHERRFALFLIPLSLLLSTIGLLFLYFVMLPAMMAFLIHFGGSLGEPSRVVVEAPQGMVFPSIPMLPGEPADPPPGGMWYNSELKHLQMNLAAEGQDPVIMGTPIVRAAGIAQQYRLSEYINLVFTMSLAFVVGFQTPVAVLLLGWMGIVNRRMLAKNRKYAFFLAFVVAAILTPSPDPFSMTLLALPLYMLYELGLLMLNFIPASRIAEGSKWMRRRRQGSAPPLGVVDKPEDYGSVREPPDAGDA